MCKDVEEYEMDISDEPSLPEPCTEQPEIIGNDEYIQFQIHDPAYIPKNEYSVDKTEITDLNMSKLSESSKGDEEAQKNLYDTKAEKAQIIMLKSLERRQARAKAQAVSHAHIIKLKMILFLF